MTAEPLQTLAFASHSLASPVFGAGCTLTLELPVAAQALSPGERPLGSVVKIEVDGLPVTDDTPIRGPLPILRPALLTLTF